MEVELEEAIDRQVKIYSVVVGFVLVLVFVVPCITLALVAKCFQKQTTTSSSRKGSVRHSMGSFKMTGGYNGESYGGETGQYLESTLPDSDSSGFGTFGLIELPLKKLDCIERIVTLKHQQSFMEIWKAHAPPSLFGGSDDCKKIIVAMKPTTAVPALGQSGGKDNYGACLKAELSYLSRIPSHHAILNLLGACSPNANSSANVSAILLEYPVYGNLHAFLVCKRLGRISNNAKGWAGLDYESLEGSVLKALPDENRPYLSSLLDDLSVRIQPFKAALNVGLNDVDLLLFAMQIANGMQFLNESGIFHKHLSSESVTITCGFFLKISCISADSMSSRFTGQSMRRTTSGRNMIRWDAPEVIDKHEFTEKSSVWRFGMVLWEISSLGDTPYAEVPGKSLVEQMKKGDQPHLPQGCSNELYRMMKKCWEIEPSCRPTFDDLSRIILSQLQPHESKQLNNSESINSKSGFQRQYRPSRLSEQQESPVPPGGSSSSVHTSSCSDTLLLAPELSPDGYEETEV